MRRGAGLVKGDGARLRLQGRQVFCRIVEELSRGVASGQVSLGMRVQSVGPGRAGDGTESVMMTPGYLWARLMHADVGGGDGVCGETAARVEPRCDGFCDSGIAQGMRSCLFFLSSVCNRTGQGVSGSVGDRENVVEGLCQTGTLMSGTLQIVGRISIQGWSSRRLSGSLESSSGSGTHCFGNVWPLEKRVGARCRLQVQARCRLQQSGSVVGW